MVERIYIWFMEHPRRMTSLGQLLVVCGGGLLVLAAIGKVLLLVASMGKPSAITLAATFPQLPTLLVPETAIGVASAFVVVLAGLVAYVHGRKFERLLARW
ncbi:MAG TPA: hypothetical protein VIL30_17615 [Ramlibacter sp.]|jgi:hypothetical protein